MKLYLAQFDTQISEYMNGRKPIESNWRLVSAANEQEAERAVRERFEVNDPYGGSRHVTNITIHETISVGMAPLGIY